MTDEPIDGGPIDEPPGPPKCAICGKQHLPGPCPKSRSAEDGEG